jgi:antitoxin component YwqK of YwqJK toxin-antitoxin module
MAQVQRTYDKNGKLESECFEINGIKNGEGKSYYPNRSLNVICLYIDGKINGEILSLPR